MIRKSEGFQSGCQRFGLSLLQRVHYHRLSIAFVSWIGCGTLFYAFTKGVPIADGIPAVGPLSGIEAFFEAVTIGYSVGLAPRNPDYLPSPYFSSAYILVGASLIAVILTTAGQKVGDAAALHVFEDLIRREKYEGQMSSDSPRWKRAKAFFKYNAWYLIAILGWLLWLVFIILWSMASTDQHVSYDGTPLATSSLFSFKDGWSFGHAQYFAISLCSSAGSFSLPSDSPLWSYLLAAISMAIGVPLMALAISSMAIMWMQGSSFDRVKKAAWTPVTQRELETLMKIGLGRGEEVISKSDYVLLGLLRMGTDAGMIEYLCDCFDQAQEEAGCVCLDETGDINGMSSKNTAGAGGGYSEQARAYLSGSEPDNKIMTAAGKSRGLLVRNSTQHQVPGNRVSMDELSAAMASISQGVQTSSSSRRSCMHPSTGRRDMAWSIFGNTDQGSASNLRMSVMLGSSAGSMGAESPSSCKQASSTIGLATLEEAPEDNALLEDAGDASSDSFCNDT